MNKKECIVVESISVAYNNKIVLDNISFTIPQGVRCAIVGPNGAGKTTLMKALLSLHSLQKGSVTFFNQSYNSIRNEIAYVPQRKNVDWNFPITVYDVVLMGALPLSNFLFSSYSNIINSIVIESLSRMGLESLKDNHINDLSGGQQQRVFIARALAQKAQLFILDEPLTGLDKVSEKMITDIFFSLQKENKTVVAVHHDWNTLHHYFDWVLFLNKSLFYCGPYDKANISELLDKTF